MTVKPTYEELEQRVRDLENDLIMYKQVEKALRDGEERYRRIFDVAVDGLVIMDSEGIILDANPSYRDTYGYSLADLKQKQTRDLLHPDHKDDLDEFFRQIRRTGTAHVESKLFRKDGTEFPIDVHGVEFAFEGRPAFLAVLRDIRDQKKEMDMELVKTKTLLQNIFDSSIDGITITDLHGNIMYTSPRVKDLLGYDQDEAIGKKAYIFYENSKEDGIKIEKELSAKGEVKDYEMRYRKKNDEIAAFSVSASFLRNENKEIIGTLGIYRDITEKKRLEAQFHQAQKMESIGTLAGGIAHDFNNLLMGILGNASIMLLNIDSDHSHYERLKQIEQHVQSGADLTRQLLGFARGGKYEVKSTDLNALIEKSSTMFSRTRKEIGIHRKCQENIWTVEVNQGQIEQVLLNLYVNSWHAMSGGGELYLQTKNVVLDEDFIKPYNVVYGKYVQVSVTDTGVGMDEATRQRIFDPFFSTKDIGRVTGLGLSSAYGIVKNHGGIITVYSEKGKGTTFNIYLPASEIDLSKDEQISETILKGTGTILFVDDEEIIIDVGREILMALGYQVLPARGGKEAVEIYRKNQDRIDMVIMDMIMSEMAGGEAYDRIKEINPNVKVLLSSGYSVNTSAKKILERGCNGFIQKPFDTNLLSRKIREILDDKGHPGYRLH